MAELNVNDTNELIEVKNNNGELLVSARELHKGLGIDTKFQDWFKRMLKYGFEESEDYNKFEYKVQSQKRERTYTEIDYILKIDMAKEIAMIQRNDKGREVRKYFLECERKLKEQIPQLNKKQQLQLSILNGNDMEKVVALKEYEKLIEAPLKAKIEEDKPKVDYFENFMNSNKLFTSTQVAKLYGLSSGQKLNKLLNENKIIYKQGKSWLPYAGVDESYYKQLVNEYGTQLKFTSKGVLEIAKIVGVELNEEELKGE